MALGRPGLLRRVIRQGDPERVGDHGHDKIIGGHGIGGVAPLEGGHLHEFKEHGPIDVIHQDGSRPKALAKAVQHFAEGRQFNGGLG